MDNERKPDQNTLVFFDGHMERIQAFETMLSDIMEQYEHEKKEMEELRAKGREKSATYRQYMGNRLFYNRLISLYEKYGLLNGYRYKS